MVFTICALPVITASLVLTEDSRCDYNITNNIKTT